MPILGSIIKQAITIRGRIPARKNVYKQQLKQLNKLLSKAQFTSFGEYYGFSELLLNQDPLAAFKKKVPVSDYQSIFDLWWHRALKGEKDVCWPGKINYFALSSGTSTAASKHIPVTKDMIKAIQKGTIKQILSTKHFNFSIKQYETEALFVGGSTNLNYNGTYFSGDLSGITTGTQPRWFQNFSLPGPEIRSQTDWEKKLEDIVLNAKKWNVGFICGVPAWIQILFERIIKHYNVKNIHDVWPNLAVFVHGGVSVQPYKNSINAMCAKSLIYLDTYMASEGFIAYQERPNEQQAMKLMTDNSMFFEFIPFNEENFDGDGNLKPNNTTLDITQVNLNTDYALVLTNCAGAWRYLIGDTIRFTDLTRCEIIVTGRTRHFLSLCGEHLSVDNMNQAMMLTARDLNLNINEFCVVGTPNKGLFAHHWYVGVDKEIDKENLTEILDGYLKKLNDDYATERNHALNEVIVTLLPNQAFIDFLASKNKLGGQSKFPRVLKGKHLNEWNAFLENYNK
ncbi:GH3 auxin-responsive promoter family protein [Sediminibacterium sp.]|uniref:GH3 family domain-containing protein n=1 Tax=Sediminibacterium sp. TaxID=1917865 RepID=UPI0027375142|nr:GH3 auxin-responsive promoter family protein [Sediminibacterium sp.]MDP3567556.1 GH3 auxin-responsive promoter family protein [Sediminibacterium sp.]